MGRCLSHAGVRRLADVVVVDPGGFDVEFPGEVAPLEQVEQHSLAGRGTANVTGAYKKDGA